MFYRLWAAMKRRPTRTMFIGSGVLLFGMWPHMFLSATALDERVQNAKNLPPAQFDAFFDSQMRITHWMLFAYGIAWACAAILFAWGLVRGWQGKP